MRFLRAWWLQILGVVVVLGFLGWLVLVGGKGVVAHVVATPTPSPSLSATQQIEQTVKDFVVAYEKSGLTGDASGAQSFTEHQSPAEGDAGTGVLLARQTGQAVAVDSRAWDDSSWRITEIGGGSGTADVSLTESFRIVSVSSGSVIQSTESKTFSWHSEMRLNGSSWKIESFTLQ